VRTAIIGGGITGLAAAWELSLAGRQTVLIEEQPSLGGVIQTASSPPSPPAKSSPANSASAPT
jgi:protoporphyrinogen oxidase